MVPSAGVKRLVPNMTNYQFIQVELCVDFRSFPNVSQKCFSHWISFSPTPQSHEDHWLCKTCKDIGIGKVAASQMSITHRREQSNLPRRRYAPSTSIPRLQTQPSPVSPGRSGVRGADFTGSSLGVWTTTATFPSTGSDFIEAHEYSALISIALAFWPPHLSGINESFIARLSPSKPRVYTSL